MIHATRSRRRCLVHGFSLAVLCAFASLSRGQMPDRPPPVQVDADGTVHVPAYALPVSEFLSPAARAYLVEHLKPDPALLRAGGADNGVPPLIAGYLKRQNETFAVERREILLGGVRAYDYTPREGIARANRRRVLINLHGGGFMGCWPGCAELESIPVAAMGHIRVVSLDYRQSPQHRHPAASEDVAAAYRALLKDYAPQNIGIYGCSAGGMLTGMAVAWFQKENLPRPGAVGVLCSGLTLAGDGFGGDSSYTTPAIGDGRPPPRPGQTVLNMPYFAAASANDPLASPASSASVLARFPPTLMLSGTRSFDLSATAYTHGLLVKAGVEAELHVSEGMFHGFFYNTDVPESRDAYALIVRFFDRHLGKR